MYSNVPSSSDLIVPSPDFPDPTYKVIDETYIITYKVFINPQPAGLPLDHVSTLNKSFEFWENQELELIDHLLKK